MKRILLLALLTSAAFAGGFVTHRAFMPVRVILIGIPVTGDNPSEGPAAPAVGDHSA